MEPKAFPIPNSGELRITHKGPDLFDVECSQVDTADYHQLYGFFSQMLGRFGEFRFEYTNVVHSKCRFNSDSINFVRTDRTDIQ
jgi:hypothetical protein